METPRTRTQLVSPGLGHHRSGAAIISLTGTVFQVEDLIAFGAVRGGMRGQSWDGHQAHSGAFC